MQNIDAETGLQSKKEPSLYFSSQFVFGNDSPRLPLEVNPMKKYYDRELDQGLDPAVLRITQSKFIIRNVDKF